jgi:thymidylate synthase
MNQLDNQYKKLISLILKSGKKKNDRTGTGTVSIFGHQMRFNLKNGFPLLTLRKIHTKSLIHEMLWFLSSFDEKYKKFGNTNIKYLLDHGVTFWSEWPYENYKKIYNNRGYDSILSIKEYENRIKNDDNFALEFGSIGPGYGEQWLNSGGIEMVEIIDNDVYKSDDDIRRKTKKKIIKLDGINQINQVINTLKKNPDSRRMIVDSWNPININDMLLPPCHMMFQFYSVLMTPNEKYDEYYNFIETNNLDKNMPYNKGLKYYNFPDRYLSIQMYQRSVDVGLGLPFNISEYSLLLSMISQIVNMVPNEMIWTGGDTHIYNNHIDQLNELIKREPKPLPKLILNKNIKNIYDFRYNDIIIQNYNPHPNIKMKVSI